MPIARSANARGGATPRPGLGDPDEEVRRSLRSLLRRAPRSDLADQLHVLVRQASDRGAGRASSHGGAGGRKRGKEEEGTPSKPRREARGEAKGGDEESRRSDSARSSGKEKKEKKKKKKKKKKKSKSSQAVQLVVAKPDEHRDAAGGTPLVTEPLTAAHFDRALALSVNSVDSAASDLGSVSSGNLADALSLKDEDPRRLHALAEDKFRKGMQCARRERHALARAKFRAALKARLLLHEDLAHASLVPLHEMLGLMERELGRPERSRRHLATAREICEGALRRLEAEEGGERAAAAEEAEREWEERGEGEEGDGTGEQDPAAAGTNREELRRILQENIDRLQKAIAPGVETDATLEAHVASAGSLAPTQDGDGPEQMDIRPAATEPAKESSGSAEDGSHVDTVVELAARQEPQQIEETDSFPEAEASKQPQQRQHQLPEDLPTRHPSKQGKRVSFAKKEDGRCVEEGEEEKDGVHMWGEKKEEDEQEEEDVTEEIHIDPVEEAALLRELPLEGEDEDGSYTSGSEYSQESWLPTIAENSSDSESEKPAARAGDSDGKIAAAPPNGRRHRDGGPPPVRIGYRRMSTSSESHLRLLHRAHSLEGEELYAAGRYAPAAGCFNDAKFALLIIAGLSGGAAAGGPTRHAKLTDRINSVGFVVALRLNEITKVGATTRSVCVCCVVCCVRGCLFVCVCVVRISG